MDFTGKRSSAQPSMCYRELQRCLKCAIRIGCLRVGVVQGTGTGCNGAAFSVREGEKEVVGWGECGVWGLPQRSAPSLEKGSGAFWWGAAKSERFSKNDNHNRFAVAFHLLFSWSRMFPLLFLSFEAPFLKARTLLHRAEPSWERVLLCRGNKNGGACGVVVVVVVFG